MEFLRAAVDSFIDLFQLTIRVPESIPHLRSDCYLGVANGMHLVHSYALSEREVLRYGHQSKRYYLTNASFEMSPTEGRMKLFNLRMTTFFERAPNLRAEEIPDHFLSYSVYEGWRSHILAIIEDLRRRDQMELDSEMLVLLRRIISSPLTSPPPQTEEAEKGQT